jgi:elongation factor G
MFESRLAQEEAQLSYSTQDIRNIALVGQAGAGKTTLVERLLFQSGAIPAMGSVARGDTVADSDPRERSLQHSLDTSLVNLSVQGRQVNLLDTPGHADFLGRAISVLPAVEIAAVVVNAQTGIDPLTHRMMEAAANRNLCRLVVVNKIDAEGTDLRGLVESLQRAFGKECLPINLPADGGRRVLDCFFQPTGERADFSSVGEAHDRLIDQVVEVDEDLMALYLEQGQDLQPEQLHDPFEAALRQGHLIPVCFVSAQTGAGVAELLNIIARLMPNPAEGNPPPYMKGEGAASVRVQVAPDPGRHALAHVFKVVNDPFRGRLGIFRIHQGTITPNSQLYIGDARKAFKVTHLFRLQGKDQQEMERGIPGDICAVARVDEIYFDAVLHDSHDEDHHHLRSMECPVPLYGLAVKPAKRGDEQKLSDALHKLQAEDPCFQVDHNVAANETVMRGLGAMHIQIVLEQLQTRFHVDVETHTPSIAYRETITKPAEGHHRHKKQTGGAGQFGEVFLRVRPLERNQGFQFVDAVVGGAIPNQFIPAVEKGVRAVLEQGAVAGYPLQDVEVTVYDGKFHPVDSKEIAFVTAGRRAFLDAVAKAGPILLEPIVNIRIEAPHSAMGDLTGDLSGKRGKVSGTEMDSAGRMAILGEVPLAELDGYESRLKSITAGEGHYSIEFRGYEPVPSNIQKDLAAKFSATIEAD